MWRNMSTEVARCGDSCGVKLRQDVAPDVAKGWSEVMLHRSVVTRNGEENLRRLDVALIQ